MLTLYNEYSIYALSALLLLLLLLLLTIQLKREALLLLLMVIKFDASIAPDKAIDVSVGFFSSFFSFSNILCSSDFVHGCGKIKYVYDGFSVTC